MIKGYGWISGVVFDFFERLENKPFKRFLKQSIRTISVIRQKWLMILMCLLKSRIKGLLQAFQRDSLGL